MSILNRFQYKPKANILPKFFQERFLGGSAPKILLFGCSILLWIYWAGFSSAEVEIEYMKLIQDPEYSGAKECGSFPCLGNSMCKPLQEGLVMPTSRSVKKYKSWRHLEGIFVDRNLPSRFRNCSVFILESNTCGKNRHMCNAAKIAQIDENVQQFRETVCKGLSRKSQCNVEKKLDDWDLINQVIKIPGHLPFNLVRNISPTMQCASQRFVNRLVRRSIERNGYVSLNRIDKSKLKSLIFKMKFAPGLLVKEAFPDKENWPFGSAYGSCGRITVVSKPGIISLDKMFSAPWKIRVDLASQLLHISQKLTENDAKFLFLMPDLKTEDFVIAIDGKLTIKNTDDIVVVDKVEAGENRKEETRNEIYEVKHPFVYDNTVRNQFCLHMDTDINYYTVCRIIESGLLQFPREKEEITSQILFLLDACIHGSAKDLPRSVSKLSTSVRNAAVKKLQTVLNYIRPCSPEVSYRYPECKWVANANDIYQPPWFEVL